MYDTNTHTNTMSRLLSQKVAELETERRRHQMILQAIIEHLDGFYLQVTNEPRVLTEHLVKMGLL